MTCDESGDLLEAWTAGTLPPREALGISSHLADCAACRAQVELSLRILGSLREIPLERAPSGLAPAVLARLDPEKLPWRWVAAAGVLLAVGGWWLPPWETLSVSLPDLSLQSRDMVKGALRLWEIPVPPFAWVLALAIFSLTLWSARKEPVHG